ncbi:unnamed protein product [Coffea canephora]|uniref:Enoyl-CoA hydratase/isomerase family protein n=1 Tax=Coffea canephora TaxID=49390 RepID=A0A068V7I7_COFCA|nr:unnamed protein product [Coffea canephora]
MKLTNLSLLTLNQASYGNVLNPELIQTIRECLDVVKSEATKESVLITTGEGEVFCKGFDDRYAREQAKGSNESYKRHYEMMIDDFKHVVSDLISLPMPTIAAINGYTQEAGVMLGLSHDYLTMKNGTRCLQLSLSAKQMALPAYFAALIRSKVAYPLAYRNFVLCDSHYDTKAAAKIHILETKPEPGDNALEVAEEKANHLAGEQQKLDKWNGEVYAELRKALYPELCKELGLTCSTILPDLNS